MTSFSYIIAAPLALYIIFKLIESAVENYRLGKIAQRHGCAKVYHPRNLLPFGLDRFIRLIYHVRVKHDVIEWLSADTFVHPSKGVNMLGASYVISIQPENFKAVLSTNFQDFSLGHRKILMQEFLGNGIFNADGKIWEHSRAILRPQFTRTNLADLTLLEGHVQSLLKEFRDGGFVEVQDLFQRLMMDVSTETLFGESVHNLDGGDVPRPGDKYNFSNAFDRAQILLMLRFRLQKLGHYIYPSDYLDCLRIIHSRVDGIIAKALQRREENIASGKTDHEAGAKYVFLDALTEETQDPVILRDQVVNLLIAGRDTTAGLLTFALYHLSESPRIYQKLRKEVIETFGKDNSKQTFESLKACKYLQYVMNETLRLYPAVPLNNRLAERNTVVPVGGGPNFDQPIFIKKGMRVDFNVWAMHRRKETWGEDSFEYSPERWEPSSKNYCKPGPWDYLPFNGGPRICIGQQYALTTAGYVLTRLCQSVEKLELHPEARIQYDAGVTIKNEGGVKVRAHFE